jgi:putative acetyltransferase
MSPPEAETTRRAYQQAKPADAAIEILRYSPLSVGGHGGGSGPHGRAPGTPTQGIIGSKLVEMGDRKLKDAACPFVIVVGHANFYPRFCRFSKEWEVPDDVFMLLVLDQPRMQCVSGLGKYRHEFSTVS